MISTASQYQMMSNGDREILQESGKKVVITNDIVFGHISNVVHTFDDVKMDYSESFVYQFIHEFNLTSAEKDFFGNEAIGLYRYPKNDIIIKRTELRDKESFASVLLHELSHAQHNYEDNTRNFENDLTNLLGILFCQI